MVTRRLERILARMKGGLSRRIKSQRGATGIEAAIILIPFVVVASAFALAVPSMGMTTIDKSKNSVHAGVARAVAALELRGAVIAEDADNDGMNVFVAGETASGKTTMLNALTSFIPPSSRIVRVEDTPELQVPHPNVTHLKGQSVSTGSPLAIPNLPFFEAKDLTTVSYLFQGVIVGLTLINSVAP